MTTAKRIGIISIFYIISYGLMLFNKGVYWDDWVWYKMDIPLFYNAMSQLGAPWLADYFNFIFSFHNILIFRCITFFAYWGALIFLYFILKTIKELDEDNRTYISIFFAIYPLNTSRMMVSLSQYALSYFLFFGGFFLMASYMKKKNIAVRITSLGMFFISFTTNSLLVFYCLALLYIAYIEKLTKYTLLVTAKKYLDFIALPIVFWILKKTFFITYGSYAGYNGLQFGKILLSPLTGIAVLFTASIQTMIYSLAKPLPTLLLIVASIAVYILLSQMKKNTVSILNEKKMVLFGLGLFFISIFPYLAVGVFPGIGFAESRHQLLLPLSLSILLVYSTSFLITRTKIPSGEKIKQVILSLLIVIFVSYNAGMCFDFQKDWYKQRSLIAKIENSPEVFNNTTFLFKDKTLALNVLTRDYRYYEFNGMMKHAFGDEKRLGYDMKTGLRYKQGKEKPIWLIKDYHLSKEVVMVIKEGDLKLTATNVLRLLYDEYFNPEKFNKDINNIIALTVEVSDE